MSGSYIPPIASKGSVASAALSGSVSLAADAEVARITSAAGLESEEAAAARRQEEEAKQHRWTVISGSVAGFSMAAALIAMYIEASMIAYLAFVFPLVVAPCAIVQRRKLNKLPTFKEELNKIRLQVNEMAIQNNRLMNENSRLEKQVGRLHDMEETLDNMVRQAGGDVTEFRALVQENGDMQREMKRMQETQIMQQLLTAFLASDANKDFQISQEEMDRLVMRIKLMGVNKRVDSSRLRETFAMSPTSSVLTMYSLTAEMLEKDKLELSKGPPQQSSGVVV